MDKNDNDYCFYLARMNIKKYRQQKGITAQELADLSGFTHQYIRDLECIKLTKRPRLDNLARIANALDIDIRQLFDEVDDQKNLD